ncbi:hypothetical protein Sru01_46630 [Sphaerisporangium rufum]|uniref:DUF4352 domain-containing protein n=1 Tax=Sphaerisporangium rufum TaxID=1381558 RepID=A0A919R775_9ACTN|nr:hypothetical protein Sru01_46630 [Sphaerisporangium rufum]
MPVLAVLVAAAVGLTTAFGGLEESPEPEPVRLGKGGELDQGRMRTVFQDAEVGAGQEHVGVPDKRYLRIVLKVTNQSDRTISAQTMDNALITVRTDVRRLKPPAGSDDLGPRIVTLDDGTHPYGQLHPGVPTTVVMAFELAQGERAPKSVRIEAATFVLTESFMSGDLNWLPVLKREKALPDGEPTPAPSKATRPPQLVAAEVDLPVRVAGS